jgi:hypothetical protein
LIYTALATAIDQRVHLTLWRISLQLDGPLALRLMQKKSNPPTMQWMMQALLRI